MQFLEKQLWEYRNLKEYLRERLVRQERPPTERQKRIKACIQAVLLRQAGSAYERLFGVAATVVPSGSDESGLRRVMSVGNGYQYGMPQYTVRLPSGR